MDLDEPPSDTGNTDTGNTTGHEVAQNTGESSKFLIRCETGPIAGAAWISPPPTSKVYEENQKVMKILREEQENSQAPLPSTSVGAQALAVTVEMSNQDIKALIPPSDTQSLGSESDSDSAKWWIACRKTTALDIVTIMAGNTDAAVALVENLITKKPSNPRNRENRSRGDTGRSRKALPRMVKGHPYHFSQLRDQKVSQLRGYMFHKRESNSSDSEEEQKRPLRHNN